MKKSFQKPLSREAGSRVPATPSPIVTGPGSFESVPGKLFPE